MKLTFRNVVIPVILLICLIFTACATEKNAQANKEPAPSLSDKINKLYERFQLLFTKDTKDKVRILLDLAQRKLVEAEDAIKNGKTEDAKKALGNYERYLEEAERLIEAAAKKGEDVGKETLRIQEAKKRSIDYLTRIKSKIPRKARTVIDAAIAKTKASYDEGLKKLEKIRDH